jgi:anthraniloyl-CoA monooxygenase
MVWFENAAKYVSLAPIDLAFSAMMRSGRVSYEDLKKRAPEFIERYEAAAGFHG